MKYRLIYLTSPISSIYIYFLYRFLFVVDIASFFIFLAFLSITKPIQDSIIFLFKTMPNSQYSNNTTVQRNSNVEQNSKNKVKWCTVESKNLKGLSVSNRFVRFVKTRKADYTFNQDTQG